MSIASGLAAIAAIAALVVYLNQPRPPRLHTAVAHIAIVDTQATELRGPLYEQADKPARLSDATRDALATLRSRTFVEQVARDLGLLAPDPAPKAGSPGTNFFDTMAGAIEEPKPVPKQTAIVDAFLNDLKVAAVDGSDIEVRFTAMDAPTAIRTANRMAERFRETHAAAPDPSSDATAAKLKDELAALEREAKQLGESDAAAQNQPADEDVQHAATEAHEAARAEVAAADARLNRARDMVLAGEAHKLLDPETSPLARYLVDGRSSIQRLMSTQKDPDSARGQQLATDLAGIDRQIARQVQQITEKLQQTLEAAKAREAQTAKALDNVEAHKGRSLKSAESLARVQTAMKAKHAELSGRTAGGATAGSVRVTPASVATVSSPAHGDTTATATAIAAAAGLITAFVGLGIFGAWSYVSSSRPEDAAARAGANAPPGLAPSSRDGPPQRPRRAQSGRDAERG